MSSVLIQKQIKRERLIKALAFLSVVAFIFAIILKVENMLISVILAVTTSYILDPAINYLERKGLSRPLSVTLVFLAISLLVALASFGILPALFKQASTLKTQFPKYIKETTKLIENIEIKLSFLSDIFQNFDFSEQAESYLTEWTTSFFEDIPKLLSNSVTTMFLTPLLTFFMLKDGRKFSKILFSMVPNNFFETSLNLRHQLNAQIGSFIRARFVEAGIVGGVVWLGLAIIGFPYAPLLALFAALTNLIPYIGPIIGAVPAIIIAAIGSNGFIDVFIVTIPYLIAQLIDIFFIIPLVVAKIVDLHPLTVIISFIIGAELLGVLGMIIAIPVTSAMKLIIFTFYRYSIGVDEPI